jgi:hypothetical protein
MIRGTIKLLLVGFTAFLVYYFFGLYRDLYRYKNLLTENEQTTAVSVRHEWTEHQTKYGIVRRCTIDFAFKADGKTYKGQDVLETFVLREDMEVYHSPSDPSVCSTNPKLRHQYVRDKIGISFLLTLAYIPIFLFLSNFKKDHGY